MINIFKFYQLLLIQARVGYGHLSDRIGGFKATQFPIILFLIGSIVFLFTPADKTKG